MEGAFTDVPISVTYNKDAGGVETATIVYGSTTVNVSGDDVSDGLIKGPAGTDLEGLRIGFNTTIGETTIPNSTSDSTTITLSKGAFAEMTSVLQQYTKSTSGLIDQEIKDVDEKNLKLEKEIADIDLRAQKEISRQVEAWGRIYETIMQFQQVDFMLDSMIKAAEAA